MQIIKYLVIFFWIEAILVLSMGCTAPKQRRGDWMEHLNYRQFNFNAPMIHWDRHTYYSKEELHEMWEENYNRAIQDLPDAAVRVVRRNKAIADNDLEKLINEDIHKWAD